jgi:hypothetical protein
MINKKIIVLIIVWAVQTKRTEKIGMITLNKYSICPMAHYNSNVSVIHKVKKENSLAFGTFFGGKRAFVNQEASS